MLVTLKYGQGNQTWFELLDPQKGYNHAKFERPPLNSVCEKPTIKILSNQKTRQLHSLDFQKVKISVIFIIFLTYLTIPQRFNLSGLEHYIFS